MKTKEEILQEEVDKIPDFASPYYNDSIYDGTDLAILNAMDAYVKQEIERRKND